jgi:hypothetical protein
MLQISNSSLKRYFPLFIIYLYIIFNIYIHYIYYLNMLLQLKRSHNMHISSGNDFCLLKQVRLHMGNMAGGLLSGRFSNVGEAF